MIRTKHLAVGVFACLVFIFGMGVFFVAPNIYTTEKRAAVLFSVSSGQYHVSLSKSDNQSTEREAFISRVRMALKDDPIPAPEKQKDETVPEKGLGKQGGGEQTSDLEMTVAPVTSNTTTPQAQNEIIKEDSAGSTTQPL